MQALFLAFEDPTRISKSVKKRSHIFCDTRQLSKKFEVQLLPFLQTYLLQVVLACGALLFGFGLLKAG